QRRHRPGVARAQRLDSLSDTRISAGLRPEFWRQARYGLSIFRRTLDHFEKAGAIAQSRATTSEASASAALHSGVFSPETKRTKFFACAVIALTCGSTGIVVVGVDSPPKSQNTSALPARLMASG